MRKIFFVLITVFGVSTAAYAMDGENGEGCVTINVSKLNKSPNQIKSPDDFRIDIDNLSKSLGQINLDDENQDLKLAQKLRQNFNLDSRYDPYLETELKRNVWIKKLLQQKKKRATTLLNGSGNDKKVVSVDLARLMLRAMQQNGDDLQKDNVYSLKEIRKKEKSLNTKNWLLGASGGGNIVMAGLTLFTLILEGYKLISGKCS